jgi:hypothetical protein
LTCATFVLAAFHRAGLPLLRYETWAIGLAVESMTQDGLTVGFLPLCVVEKMALGNIGPETRMAELRLRRYAK